MRQYCRLDVNYARRPHLQMTPIPAPPSSSLLEQTMTSTHLGAIVEAAAAAARLGSQAARPAEAQMAA